MQVSRKQALRRYSGRAWRWSRTLLGFLLFSIWVFNYILPSRAPADFSLSYLSLLFYSLFVLWAYRDLGATGCAVLAGLAVVSVFAFSFGRGEFAFNGVILAIGAVYCVCYLSFRRDAAEEVARTAELERIEGESRLVQIEYGHLRAATGALRGKFRRYGTLKEVTGEFASTLSRDRIVRLLAARTLNILERAENCFILLVDESTRQLGLVYHLERGQPVSVKSKLGGIFDQWALKRRKALLVNDVDSDFRFPKDDLTPEERKFRSVMVCPLMVRQSFSGIVRVENKAPRVFNQGELRLLDILASLGSVAIENARLYKRTEELAIRDGLTGLFVHRYIMERFAEEHQRALASKGHLSVLMCDLDRFKGYNDRYGHAAGDSMLKRVAKLIGEDVAPGELVARYGGEEFLLVLPGVDKEHARRRAEAIRLKVEASPVLIRREKLSITLSIGVAAFPTDTLDRRGLLQKADDALYEAKHKGRNRVCLSS